MIIIIILFLILTIYSSKIRLDIENIKIINTKIRYRAKIKIYIFKYIPIYQKRIRKQDLKKIINYFNNKRARKNEKKKRAIRPKIIAVDAKIDYGIKNIFANIYLYAIINTAIALFIAQNKITKQRRYYNIKTNFDKNYFKAKIKLKMEIRLKDFIFLNKFSNIR